MIPKANYTEVKARWQLNKEKDITTFSQDLIAYANDLTHEQSRGRGAAAMDVDALAREREGGEPAYTATEWAEWEQSQGQGEGESEWPVDWMGKGGGKRGKGGKGGKGGGKQAPAHWNGLPTMTPAPENKRICFAFNDQGCPLARPGDECHKGKHVCPKCQGPHSIRNCQA